MRSRYFLVSIFAATMALPSLAPAEPWPPTTTLNFEIMRNGNPIGTSTVRLRRQGEETVAEIATHIAVKFASFTVYRFDQTETEHWAQGRLVALNAHTDDNGTVHRVTAARSGDGLAVEADGRTREVDPGIVPVSLWNPSTLGKRLALNPQDGQVTPLSVVDHGPEQLVLQGRALTARHYSIRTSFPQDVWYDEHDRLVRVELSASDGSKIRYQPG